MSRTPHRIRLAAATAAVLAGAGSVVALSQLPASAASTVVINGGTTYQTIDGFGVSEAFSQANSIRNLGGTARQQALDLLFSTSNGAGFSILRSLIPSDSGSIEPNSPGSPSANPTYVWKGDDAQDQGQLWLAKQAKNGYGVGTFYNDAWSAPGYMKTNGSESNGGSLCGTTGASCGSGDWRSAYAKYLVQHSKYWAAAGVTPSAVGFVNEPSLTTSYSSMLANAAQAGSFLSVFGPAMSASGLPTKVACCDTLGFNLLPSYVSAAGSNAGLFTSHGYSNAPTTPISAGGRHVWESEWSINGNNWTNVWDSTGEASGITWAQRIHTALTGANLNAFLYWWGISSTSHDSSLVGLSGSTLTPSKRYYALANYSRYIRPGAVRIGATSGDNSLQASAFKNTDGSVVIVVLNTGSGAVSTSYTLSNTGSAGGTVTPYLTNSGSSMAAQPAITAAGGGFSATIPARSLVTYRIAGGSTTPPTTAPPTPPTNAPTTPPATTVPATPPATTAPTTPPATTAPTTPPATTAPTTPPATAAPTTPPPSGAGCSASYAVTGTWQGGFQAAVTVANDGTAPLTGWTVHWTLSSGQGVSQVWNGNLTTSGNSVAVQNTTYNGSLGAGASTSFGFLGTGPATPVPAVTCTSP